MTISNKRRSHHESRFHMHGLTLVELSVVVFILGMIVCMGVLGLRAYHRRADAVNGIRCVTAAMQTARYRAISENRRIKLSLNKSGALELCEYVTGEWLPRKLISIPDGVDLRMNARPVFYPEGYVVPLCSAYVSAGPYRRRISISMAGRIKVTSLP